MTLRHWELTGLLGVAGLALWLLLAGPDDLGKVGMALLVSTAWISLYRLVHVSRGELEARLSPGEWRAWLGLGVTFAAVAYFLFNVRVFGAGPAWSNPEAREIGRNLVLLLIAWTVLSRLLGSRWKGVVQEDERDREIAIKAQTSARGALVAGIVGFALMLGLSPAHKLQWATHFMIANLLVLVLMWSWLCEYVVTVAMYWRDRR